MSASRRTFSSSRSAMPRNATLSGSRIVSTSITANTDCATYHEINEFLALRTDIDAVLITTGDRWHALASVLAMRAGKDVYSEKPSAMTFAEGRAVAETAHRYRRIYQTGTQRLSEGNFTFAQRTVASGLSGRRAHRSRPYRPVGCGRDEPRVARRRAAAAEGRGGLGCLVGTVPLAALQLRLHAGRLAQFLRFPHQLYR